VSRAVQAQRLASDAEAAAQRYRQQVSSLEQKSFSDASRIQELERSKSELSDSLAVGGGALMTLLFTGVMRRVCLCVGVAGVAAQRRQSHARP
jgi:hypothetical protein